jgi:hypothetical protein
MRLIESSPSPSDGAVTIMKVEIDILYSPTLGVVNQAVLGE